METSPYLTVPEAMALARVGRTTLYKLLKTGQIAARKVGHKTLIAAQPLRDYLDALPVYEPSNR